MLVLTRKVGESIVVGNVKIEVVDVRPNVGRVLIGVDAPRDVSVHRAEVWELLQRETGYADQQGTAGD